MVISVNRRLIEITKQTITGPDLDRVGAIRLVPPPPSHHAKIFNEAIFLRKIKKNVCITGTIIAARYQ